MRSSPLTGNESVLSFAQIEGAVSAPLTKENIGTCDIVLVAIYPEAAIAYVTQMVAVHRQKADGLTAAVPSAWSAGHFSRWRQEHGFTYLGGHPMAGTHNSGFKYARANLYHGAPMVLVPPVFDDIDLLQRAKDLLAPAEFGKFSVTTAEEHDRTIAFTSQLAHVVSNAYIKSPTAGSHKGFSAGSYKDMTRVAWLNPQMWAELFLENRRLSVQELSVLSENLAAYQKALETQDLAGLTKLLDDGKRRKEEVDGR